MRPSTKNTARKKLEQVEPVAQLTLADLIRADLREFVIAAGTAAIGAVLEQARDRLYAPDLGARERWRNGRMMLRWTVAAIPTRLRASDVRPVRARA